MGCGAARTATLLRFIVSSLALITLGLGSPGASAQTTPLAPHMMQCVSYLMNTGVPFGDKSTSIWQEPSAVWLCDGNTESGSPPPPVACFSSQFPKTSSWQDAVKACRTNRGLPNKAAQTVYSSFLATVAANPQLGIVVITFTNNSGMTVQQIKQDKSGNNNTVRHVFKPGDVMIQTSNPGTSFMFAAVGGTEQIAVPGHYTVGSAIQQSYVIPPPAAANTQQLSRARQSGTQQPSKATVDGNNARTIHTDSSTFSTKGMSTQWVELQGGKTAFTFDEYGRDAHQIILVDKSRSPNVWLLINITDGKVYYGLNNVANANQPIASITGMTYSPSARDPSVKVDY